MLGDLKLCKNLGKYTAVKILGVSTWRPSIKATKETHLQTFRQSFSLNPTVVGGKTEGRNTIFCLKKKFYSVTKLKIKKLNSKSYKERYHLILKLFLNSWPFSKCKWQALNKLNLLRLQKELQYSIFSLRVASKLFSINAYNANCPHAIIPGSALEYHMVLRRNSR